MENKNKSVDKAIFLYYNNQGQAKRLTDERAEIMEKIVEIGMLFDYYGRLLTQKQYEMIDQYYHEDFSLTEIAEIHDITKQAVSENIKRAEKKLYDYEDKLALVDRNRKERQQIEEALKKLEKILSQEGESIPKVELESVYASLKEYELERLEA